VRDPHHPFGKSGINLRIVMADIIPFKAWRYNTNNSGGIDELTSPLFDVVSQRQREKLYQNKYNSIHLSVPIGNDPFENARMKFEEWKEKNVLFQDQISGIYPYFQIFSLPGEKRDFYRKGFICFVKISSGNDQSVLLHENTIPQAVQDRTDLLKKTQLNVAPTHGLYSDPEFILENYLDEAISEPIYETEDYQGVKDKLSVIHDRNVISKFQKLLKDQKIILADGHHRFQSSLEFQAESQRKNPHHTGEELYNYHLMYLTNSASHDLRILPTHRLVKDISNFDPGKVMDILEKDFYIREIEDPFDLEQVIVGKKHAFGIIFKDKFFKIRLREERENEIPWQFPDSIKALDLTILHYFVIEKALGIKGKIQRGDQHVSYERNFSSCLEKILSSNSQMALITNEIEMEEVMEVCHSGYTMPQKSTYFYPKVICGFLFASLQD